jgi:protein TonB
MLTVLLESRAARQRPVGGTVLSTLAHGAIIAAVVALTLPNRGDAKLTPEVHPTKVTFVRTSPPETRAAPASATSPSRPDVAAPREKLPTFDIPTMPPTTIPPIDLSQPDVTSDRVLIARGVRSPGSGAGDPGMPVGGDGGVSEASAVDRAPRIVGRAPEPRYPATLRSAGVQGRVLAEFVVDTLGRPELGTLRFAELANPLFGDAVRDALARYRFQPGEMAGRKVRTRVAVPFEFRLER